MTLRKIAEIAGCGEKTVRREAKRLWPDRVFTGKGGAALIDSDALALMANLPKRNMVSGQATGQMTAMDISAIVAETIKQFIPFFQLQSAQPLKPPAQIEAPKLETRDELRRIVAQAGKASGDFPGAWGQLYQEIYYRMHRNVNECAKNRGMDKLDYIESEGMLPEVIAIAREVFQ